MYRFTMIAAAAAFVGGVNIANAADLGGSLKDEPIASYGPGYSWAGLYVGGSAGFGVGDTSGKLELPGFVPPAIAALFQSDYDVNGAIYGGHIGYNFQRGNIVFGVEAGLNGTNIDGSENIPVIGPISVKSERELNWYATAVGRLGYASGNALFYGFGGVAWGNIDTTLSVPVFPGASVNGDSDHVGWTAGLGIEYALNDRFSVRVEYSHVDFGEDKAKLSFGDEFSINDKVDMAIDAVKIGASYKFGGGHEPLK